MKVLTNRQLAAVDRRMSTLNYIKVYTKHEGHSPTLQEIAKRNRVCLTTAHQDVAGLEKAKLITRTPNVSRGIKINEPFDLIT